MTSPETAAATLREFIHHSGAIRACAILEGEPEVIVDVGRMEAIEIVVGEDTTELPHAAELGDPLDFGRVTQLPPFEVRAGDGEIAAPLGGLEHLALGVRALAEAFGGRSVALATFETTDPQNPLSICARPGDALVLSLGEDDYEMDDNWPPSS